MMINFELHEVTNTKGGGASDTERQFRRVGAKLGKGRRNGLTIRKLLSLQKGVR